MACFMKRPRCYKIPVKTASTLTNRTKIMMATAKTAACTALTCRQAMLTNTGKNSELRAYGHVFRSGLPNTRRLKSGAMRPNPRSARLPTPTLPGAIDQKIRINTKLLLGGLVNDAQLTDRMYATYWPYLATM
jgi:hypothetical protein